MHKEEVIFNFESLEALNKTLKEETEKIFDSIKYEKDMDLPKTNALRKNLLLQIKLILL